MGGDGSLLVRHHDQESFFGVFVRLELVVGAMDASAAGEEEQELAGRVWVVGGLCHIGVDVVEFGHFLRDSFSTSFKAQARHVLSVHQWVRHRMLQAGQLAGPWTWWTREDSVRVGRSVTQCSCTLSSAYRPYSCAVERTDSHAGGALVDCAVAWNGALLGGVALWRLRCYFVVGHVVYVSLSLRE